MQISVKIIKPGLCAIFGVLLTGCTAASLVSPTGTPTRTQTKVVTTTPTPTASPIPPPTATPTATATIVPPVPEMAQIVIGKHYSYFPGTIDHDQATVEYVDLSSHRNKLFLVNTDTQGYKIRIGLYRGKIDLAKWWGDSATFIQETEFVVDSSITILVSPGGSEYSIVYITRPVQNKSPENLEIIRSFSVQDPKYPSDWSRTVVTEFWTFPDSHSGQTCRSAHVQ